ncbi:hypothetical protein [uncultured Sunxiuqinia sp.]|uniref:hypothetical protein n=1 Tax=uncultured Sunxiuqinia sp. TaxID=1573825 RepID=UPI002AA8F507|nr:hypothetical protein [uncultured Sunxiuqinia sp.]
MKNIILGLLAIISVQVLGQNNDKIDFTTEIKGFDISNLLTLSEFNIEASDEIVGRPEPLGYIGENYLRFRIHFISVIQNPKNSMEYFVYGKSKVKNNICDFQGILTVEKAMLFAESEFPTFKQGLFNGKYEFFENPNQKGTGVFKGRFHTFFYIDTDGKIKYDALMFVADGFENNQFEGTWTSYNSGNPKKCNWGDFRIPDSGNFDSGAGEFGPNSKYAEFGWESYLKAWIYNPNSPGVEEARKVESEKWWIEK